MKRRSGRGFTLIELMIIVAVLGIFAGIFIPAYIGYTYKKKIEDRVEVLNAACKANGKHLDYKTVETIKATKDKQAQRLLIEQLERNCDTGPAFSAEQDW